MHMKEETLLLLIYLVHIFSDVNEEHRKNVIIENGKRVLYIKAVRAVYGCIQSTLLWYNLYTNTLKDKSFEINLYDKCIANKMIDDNQCTIGWCIDDSKISHKETKVVDDMLTIFKETFGDLNNTRELTRFSRNEYNDNKR